MASKACKRNTEEGWLGKAEFLKEETTKLNSRINKRIDISDRMNEH